MTPTRISERVIADRLGVVEEALRDIRSLPLGDRATFLGDRRNIWAAESCLRRSLEALFDGGRHILARGFGQGISEYKEAATKLRDVGVLNEAEYRVLYTLAGYRNRLVHFYHQVSAEELYEICVRQLGDLELVMGGFRRWLRANQDKVEKTS